ncbi:hypothetical protein RLIN73S_03122 [Rhodanobacter lindaniclasticus]
MDCLEFRRRLGAEPQARAADLLAHRDGCAACAAAWERAQTFERDLHAALNVPVPAGLAERVLLAQATGERRQHAHHRRIAFAMAASLLVALGIGGYAWRQADANSLPALAVAHMPEEITRHARPRPADRRPRHSICARRADRFSIDFNCTDSLPSRCEAVPQQRIHRNPPRPSVTKASNINAPRLVVVEVTADQAGPEAVRP